MDVSKWYAYCNTLLAKVLILHFKIKKALPRVPYHYALVMFDA